MLAAMSDFALLGLMFFKGSVTTKDFGYFIIKLIDEN